MDRELYERSLALHEMLKGKIGIKTKLDINTAEELSLVYSPGVAEPCRRIAANPDDVWRYTMKGNSVAIVTDGSAVLGLGNIGPAAALPVMEGKAMLFKRFAGINAFPICLDTQDTQEIIDTVRRIAPVFGGINLEDISAPRSFIIEEALQDLGIPVFHDDQHGTAIVVLAALMNAAKVTGRDFSELRVVVNGAGAAGVAIARLLRCQDQNVEICKPVRELLVCDSKGIISPNRDDLNESKRKLLAFTNRRNKSGTVYDALEGANVFIGVSVGGLLNAGHIRTMEKDSIVLAIANPLPEIMPDQALAGGAAVVGTGRSDLPNQVNNVLGFPGIFRGALNARARSITPDMKMAAAEAIASCVDDLRRDHIIPSSLDEVVAFKVARAVEKVALLGQGQR
jgi:malate dehydrogenase (oxaloacetate-decarboxylating)